MQGTILFNGNITFEVNFIRRFRERICASSHENPAVRDSRKVLLISAAWGQEEFQEGHIKEVLQEIGIPSRKEGGFEQNIQNLSAWHEREAFFSRHPEVAQLYRECLDTIRQAKRFYQEKNAALIDMLHRHTALVRERFPGTSLADVLGYNVAGNAPIIHSLEPERLLFHHSCQEIQGTLATIQEADERQARICQEVQQYFLQRSGLENHLEYHQARDALVDRILSSNAIFIFGGDIEQLYYTLRFWQLGDALRTALTLGTNFFTISAGSMVLCENIIVYDDFQAERGEGRQDFEFFDHGFGLVTKIKLFPHCMERVKVDDPDNLTYLAYRFGGTACVGLNENSFLLLETFVQSGRIYERFMSIGELDGVYVFDHSGNKIRKDQGERLSLPGTLEWTRRG